MNFGVPKETRDLEMRVGLTPAGVLALVQAGHEVYVQQGAGVGAGFADEHYRRSGAHIVYDPAEVYGRVDVVAKVSRPTAREHTLFRGEQTIFSFLHLSVSSPDLLEALATQEITAVAYETIQEEDGVLPVLIPMSEIAGRLAPIIAGQLMMNTHGGRGTLLSGLPGVPPAAVVILGAGVLGISAARAFLGLGAQVIILDRDVRKLQKVDDIFHGRVTTMISNEFNLQRAVDFADVMVGCVLIPGQRAPILLSREMVRRMRQRSVLMDFSIDQGGCAETSRPTTLRDQTYLEEGVIHFCVPNLTAAVARTTSYAITNAALPYLLAIGQHGLLGRHRHMAALMQGMNLFKGKLSNAAVAGALGLELEIDLPALLQVGGMA
jgi:alanine dehydrogenase